MWSQTAWVFALTYYWGLVLSVQALISPALTGPDFPHWHFLGFWSIHLLVVWAAVYLTWGRGMRPRWRSYRFVVAATLVWAAVTFTFNSIAGSNYGFLNGKPTTASLLDVLGPWPWYVVIGGTQPSSSRRRAWFVGVLGGKLIDGPSIDELVQRTGHRGAFASISPFDFNPA